MTRASEGAEPTIESLLVEAGASHRDRPAIGYEGHELSYGQIGEAVDRLASKMLRAARRGSEAATPDLSGARVVIVAPNAPALVVALLATWRLGAVAVPVSARLREHEVSRIVADAEPTLVLSVPAHLGYSFAALFERLLLDLHTVRSVLLLDTRSEVIDELRGTGARAGAEVGGDVAALLYTSGTTGTPKGTLVTHRREVHAAPRLAETLGLTVDDEVVLVVPVAHAFGFTCLLSALSAGACSILLDSTFTPRALADALARGRGTILHGSPSLFASLMKSTDGNLSRLRRGFVAGAAPPPGLIERLDRAGLTVLNLYGLTETGALSCCLPDDPPALRYTTAGRPLPGFEVRVGGEGSGAGELQVRGLAITPGYHGQPAETARAFTADGWFRTGDLATVECGYLRITGRLKELVHVGGFTVSPTEVELALLEHPDVVQAVVVGVADAPMGEGLRAFVVPRPGSALTPAGVLGFARDRIAGYKLPYDIELLPELPLLSSGKPDRGALARTERASSGRRRRSKGRA